MDKCLQSSHWGHWWRRLQQSKRRQSRSIQTSAILLGKRAWISLKFYMIIVRNIPLAIHKQYFPSVVKWVTTRWSSCTTGIGALVINPSLYAVDNFTWPKLVAKTCREVSDSRVNGAAWLSLAVYGLNCKAIKTAYARIWLFYVISCIDGNVSSVLPGSTIKVTIFPENHTHTIAGADPVSSISRSLAAVAVTVYAKQSPSAI